jgi:hypothetical protein
VLLKKSRKSNYGCRKNILQGWFGHVKRMPGNRSPQRILERGPDGTRRKGGSKKNGGWME